MSDELERAHEEANELERATPGAQRQIDTIRERMHRALRAMIVVCVLFGFGFVATGIQINRAFDNLEAERLSRIGGQSSINAYFCRKIDEVGNGVGSLVGVTLPKTPPAAATITAQQEEAFEKFRAYVEKQKQPPRCRQVALQLAILTGADPEDVVITPLHLHPSKR